MRMGMFAVVAIAACLVTAVGSAQQKDGGSDPTSRMEECNAATDVASLRQCVRDLEKIIAAQHELRRLESDLVNACMVLESLELLRECLKPLVREANPDAARRTAAFANAIRTWDIRRSKSKMDNSETIVLSLESETEVDASGSRTRPTILLRCMENVTSVYVLANWFLADNVQIQWRVDDDKAVAQTWRNSDNNKAAGLWDGTRAIPFIKGLLGKASLVMRVTPYNSGAKEMEFKLAGLDDLIGPLRAACKW